MSTEQQAEAEELSDTERYNRNVLRARAMLLGSHDPSATIPVYGLHLQRVESNSPLYDIFAPVEDESNGDPTYIDTIDVEKFVTARGLVDQVINYYPDEETAEQADTEDDEFEDPEPTPGFH